MAYWNTHLSQAEHNEELANKLSDEPPYHDWGITVAFYSAIHYFEYFLWYKPETHTETSIDKDEEGKNKYSPHAWRMKLAEKYLSKDAFSYFMDLKEASETARYLISKPTFTTERERRFWLNERAADFYKPMDAQEMISVNLYKLKKEINLIEENKDSEKE